MDFNSAVVAFGALGQETRLSVFQILVKEMPDGMPAGKIAKKLGVQPSTLSGHLNLLTQAGIISSRRNEQQIIYRLDIEGTRGLIDFLTDDCCQGRPEICHGLLKPEQMS
ncbi:MAG: helix-turn-helix transcriptional regulator [Proteobacteria bacterium]|nr:helix-turn-helix transcriptional regulator [Pseudomonadota bacterium]